MATPQKKTRSTTTQAAGTAKKAARPTVTSKPVGPATKTTAKKAAGADAGTARTSASTSRSGAVKKPAAKDSDKATATKTTAAKKTAVKKAASNKPETKKTVTTKAETKKPVTTQPKAEQPVTKRPEHKKAESKKPAKATDLMVKVGEDPWTAAELAEVRAELETEITRHESHVRAVSADLADLLDSTDSGGGDAADVGTSNFERDQELTLAAHAEEALEQCRQALQKINLGTYGQCDQCGEPIGKGRLQVYPRATLCMTCKQREERR